MRRKRERCGECLYRAAAADKGIYKCDYAAITGRCRIVNGHVQTAAECTFFRPAECTFFRPAEEDAAPAKRRRPLVVSSSGGIDREEALRLYTAGGYDTRIAAELQCPAAAVRAWRRSQGLPPNRTGGGPKHYDWARGMELWRAGAGDRDIARALGCHEHTVQNWRRRNGMAPKGKPGRPAKVVMA